MICDFYFIVDWRNKYISIILGGGGGGGVGLRVGLFFLGFISSYNFFMLFLGFGIFEGLLLFVVYDS